MASKDRKEKIRKKVEASFLPNLERTIKSLAAVQKYLPPAAPISVPAVSKLGEEYTENGSTPSLQYILQDLMAVLEDITDGAVNLLELSQEDTTWSP